MVVLSRGSWESGLVISIVAEQVYIPYEVYTIYLNYTHASSLEFAVVYSFFDDVVFFYFVLLCLFLHSELYGTE